MVLGKVHEHDGDAMLGLRQRLRHLGAQRAGYCATAAARLRHGNGNVVEASDHGPYSWHSIIAPPKQSVSQAKGAALDLPALRWEKPPHRGARVMSTLTIGRLPQARSTRRAHGAAHRLAHHLAVPAPVAGNAGDGAVDRLAHDLQHRPTLGVGGRNAVERDLGVSHHLALARPRQRDDDDARERQRAALAHRAVVARHQQVAVAEQPPHRGLVDDLGLARRQPHHLAVAHVEHLFHARGTRKLGVLRQMPRLAVHGDGDARLHPAVHLRQLLAARMAGDVHQRVAVGDDLAAQIDETVLDAPDRALVARDGARGEDDQVALVQVHGGMLVLGDAGNRGPWLALAAGAQQHHLVRRQVGEVLLVVVLEIDRADSPSPWPRR